MLISNEPKYLHVTQKARKFQYLLNNVTKYTARLLKKLSMITFYRVKRTNVRQNDKAYRKFVINGAFLVTRSKSVIVF